VDMVVSDLRCVCWIDVNTCVYLCASAFEAFPEWKIKFCPLFRWSWSTKRFPCALFFRCKYWRSL